MKILTGLVLTFLVFNTYAAAIFSSGDSILGGQRSGLNFEVGVVGFTGGANNWPGAEGPEHLIDGVGQKYLNFAELDAGAIITPVFGSSIVTSVQFWAANDAEPRDPASFELYGTNSAIGGTTIVLSLFDLISSGPLSLPSSRQAGGSAPLQVGNSQTISFANSGAYSSYLLLFPTVKDEISANSMQLAEAQLFGTAATVPEPVSLILFGLGLAGLSWSRRKNA